MYEDRNGNVCYADADHRSDYLAANGSKEFNGLYATPTSIRSTTQISRIRNSLIYRYSTGYASTYSDSDLASTAVYGLYEKSADSNIKNLADITAIATRELELRSVPRTQFEAVTFRLDNPDMPDAMRNDLISVFFGLPVVVTNLPTNMFDGYFSGFVENITMRATPTYVDLTLYISPTDFSLIAPTWATVSPNNILWSGVNATLQWSKAIGALN
jgi:hypothetical protein